MATQQINVVLRLLNGRRFQSSMNQSASSIRAAKREMEDASRAGSALGAAGHAASAGLYAVGAASRVATYLTGALAASYVGLGIQFNATMEGNALALEHFAGGADQAKAMTKELFEVAKQTPFAFDDITTAARRFLAAGFDVAETMDLLNTMGDTLSFTGGGTDEILRMVKALGDIKRKGRLMQQELNQLANLGFDPFAAMEAGGLTLTKDQLKNIGRSGIDADTALTALRLGLDKTFGGGRQKYMETFNGQWQRLVDNIKMAAGQSTKGIFGWLKDGLTDVNDFLEGNGGETANTIKKYLEGSILAVGAAMLFLKDRGAEFIDAISPITPLLKNVIWPLLKGIFIGLFGTIAVAWKLFIFQVRIFATVWGFIGKLLAPFAGLIQLIGIGLSYFLGGALVKVAGWLMKFGGWLGTAGRLLMLLALPVKIAGAALAWLGKAFLGLRAQGISGIKGLFTTVFNFLKGLPKKFWSWGKKIAVGLLAGILSVFAAAGDFAGEIGDGLRDWINSNTLFGDKVSLGPLGSVKIPMLATGGDIVGGGWAIVGENGPELARFGAGSSVVPMRPARVANRGTTASAEHGTIFEGTARPIITKVFLNRREIAEAVGEEVGYRKARR